MRAFLLFVSAVLLLVSLYLGNSVFFATNSVPNVPVASTAAKVSPESDAAPTQPAPSAVDSASDPMADPETIPAHSRIAPPTPSPNNSQAELHEILETSPALRSASAVSLHPATPDTTDWSDDEAWRNERIRELAEKAAAEKAFALQQAERRGLAVKFTTPDGSLVELMKFEGNLPRYYKTRNKEAAVSTAASFLRQSAPYAVDGSGITAGIWDGGAVRRTHTEFESRVTVKDGSSADDHATHVAGTIGARGASINAKGMAPAVAIDSYDWNSDTSEMTSRAATSSGQAGRIYFSNHSYGYIRGWDYDDSTSYRRYYGVGTEETGFGQYNEDARTLDILAFNAPYYLIFWAAGNDRSDNPSNGENVYLDSETRTLTTFNSGNPNHPKGDGVYRGNGYENIADHALAKNIVTVGAVYPATRNSSTAVFQSGAEMSSFSCWGPTDDGRIKPDLVANGVSVYSTVATNDSAYDTYNGTSMATPNAAGTAALLLDYYESLFASYPRAATLKGLLIHTADDLGNAGPDYVYGWGLINAKHAADHLLAHKNTPALGRLIEADLTAAQPADIYNFVWDGSSPIRVTLCWTDPAGTATTSANSRTARLVNDLDVLLTAPDGTSTYSPFIMPYVGDWSVAKLSAAATTGHNDRDTVEQIYLASPTQTGTYQIRVSYTGTLTNGVQNYSLLVSGNTTGASLLTPVAIAASQVSSTSFTANWNPSPGANGYYLDVATAADFHPGSAATLLTEGFADPAVPSDWTDNAMYYNSTARRGSTGYGAGFNAVDDWLQTPALAAPQTLTFWIRGSAANSALTFKVQKKIGTGPWTDVQTYASGTFSATWEQRTVALQETQNNVYLRFIVTARTANSIYLDDIEILGSGGGASLLPGYNQLLVTGNSQPVSGLNPGITYYYRVRATNGTQTTSPSNTISVTTISNGPPPPTVITSAVGSINVTSATGGGTVTADGGASVTARGLVWSLSSNPTLALNDGQVSAGSGTGSFTVEIDGLTAGTRYYVRAYATNSAGTAYGDEVSFTTLSGGGNVTLLHETFGAGLPAGWQNLDNNASGGTWVFHNPGGRTIYTATATNGFAILDSHQWGPGKTQDAWLVTPTLNLSGMSNVILTFQHYFRAYSNSEGTVAYSVDNGNTWTTLSGATFTGSDTANAATFTRDVSALVSGQSQVKFRWRYTGSYGWYWAVDDIQLTAAGGAQPLPPSITTAAVSAITATSAVSGGNVTSDGGSPVIARGIVWSTTAHPTLASHQGSTAAGSGIGSFSAGLTGLSPDTSYYLRAYATNSAGTTYGNQIYFTTPATPTGLSIPFSEDFEGTTASRWTVENTNNDDKLWTLGTASTDPNYAHSPSRFYYVQWNSSLAMNDWLFSPGLFLTGGNTYQVTFWYRVFGAIYPEKLEVKWGANNNSGAMNSSPLFRQTSLTNEGYAQASATFTPTASGTYYLGWHGYSAADQYGILIDDVAVVQVAADKPEPTHHVTNFDLAFAAGTTLTATWTDADGPVLPDGYLLAASTSSYNDILNPVDGTTYAVDVNLADGQGILQASPGVQTAAFTNLPKGSTLYVRIYPFSNTGSNTNYKTSPTVPYASSSIPAPTIRWSHTADDSSGWNLGSGATWAVITASDRVGKCFKTNGNSNYLPASSYRLTTPSLNLASSTSNELTFWMKLLTENDYDGALLEYSTNGGSNWTPMPGDWLSPTFDGAAWIAANCSNPVSGLLSWNQSRTSWTKVTADLSALDGQANVQLRFILGSDCAITDEGWYLDDFTLSGITPVSLSNRLPPPERLTIATVSDTSLLVSWNAVNGATGYRLDVSTEPTFATSRQQPIDASGFTLRQYDSLRDFVLPSGAYLHPGDYLLIARNAEKAAFESFWKVVLADNVMFINSQETSGPAINGQETYELLDRARQTVDGRSAQPMVVGHTWQRQKTYAPSQQIDSWFSTDASTATPGYGANGNGTAGLVLSEYADAPGTDNFSYEFVELYYDGTGGGGSFVSGYEDLPVAGLSATVTGLQPGQTYYLRVRSVNETGSGCSSAVVSATTHGALPPDAPQLLPADQIGDTGFRVNWSAVASAIDYRLDLSTTSDFSGLLPGLANLTVAGTSRTVNGLEPAQTYFFRVRAVNPAGTSASSSPGVATTNAALHNWLETYFGRSTLLLTDPAAVWGPLANPDQDAFNNLLEYALGISPVLADQPILIAGRTADGPHATLQFQRNKASAALLRVIAAPTLDTPLENWAILWSSANPTDTTYQVDYRDLGTIEVRTIRDSQPLGATPRFLRLSVQ